MIAQAIVYVIALVAIGIALWAGLDGGDWG